MRYLQAIAYFELQKPENKILLKNSIDLSHKMKEGFKHVPVEELAVEICVLGTFFNFTALAYLGR